MRTLNFFKCFLLLLRTSPVEKAAIINVLSVWMTLSQLTDRNSGNHQLCGSLCLYWFWCLICIIVSQLFLVSFTICKSHALVVWSSSWRTQPCKIAAWSLVYNKTLIIGRIILPLPWNADTLSAAYNFRWEKTAGSYENKIKWDLTQWKSKCTFVFPHIQIIHVITCYYMLYTACIQFPPLKKDSQYTI